MHCSRWCQEVATNSTGSNLINGFMVIKKFQFKYKLQQRHKLRLVGNYSFVTAVNMIYKIGPRFKQRVDTHLIEVDCSSVQYKSAKLKDKEHTINAPSFKTTLQNRKRLMHQVFNICWQMVSCWFMLLMLYLPSIRYLWVWHTITNSNRKMQVMQRGVSVLKFQEEEKRSL